MDALTLEAPAMDAVPTPPTQGRVRKKRKRSRGGGERPRKVQHPWAVACGVTLILAVSIGFIFFMIGADHAAANVP